MVCQRLSGRLLRLVRWHATDRLRPVHVSTPNPADPHPPPASATAAPWSSWDRSNRPAPHFLVDGIQLAVAKANLVSACLVARCRETVVLPPKAVVEPLDETTVPDQSVEGIHPPRRHQPRGYRHAEQISHPVADLVPVPLPVTDRYQDPELQFVYPLTIHRRLPVAPPDEPPRGRRWALSLPASRCSGYPSPGGGD